MAKELGKGAKIAVWIGVLTTVGVSGWAIHQFLYKPWKARRDSQNGEKDQDQDVDKGLSNGTETAPTPTTIDSFAEIKKSLGAGNYDDRGAYIVYSTSPSKLGVNYSVYGFSSPSQKILVKFTNGRRWAFFKDEVKVSNRLNEGEYSNGGKNIKVLSGKNAGRVVSGASITDNIKRTIV